ncbi:MAG: hypothetical protein M3P18_00285 [Actinomycetota bacterium]|nr:hypothetical protein [Actinomycetota bacterium]
MSETRESEDFARVGLDLSAGGILYLSLYRWGRTALASGLLVAGVHVLAKNRGRKQANVAATLADEAECSVTLGTTRRAQDDDAVSGSGHLVGTGGTFRTDANLVYGFKQLLHIGVTLFHRRLRRRLRRL